jgi:hypothetical protein
MKTYRFLTLLPVVLILSACIPSVQPFFFTTDLAYDPALVGAWRATEDGDWEQWTFTARDDTSYAIAIVGSDEKTAQLVGHLFTLGGRRYLDLTPDSVEYLKTQHDIVSVSMVPGHLLARLDQEPGGIRFAFFDFEWLGNYLKSHPDELAHRSENDSPVLTATTAELQRFVLAHAGDDELFELENRSLYTPVPADAPLPPAQAEPACRTE